MRKDVEYRKRSVRICRMRVKKTKTTIKQERVEDRDKIAPRSVTIGKEYK
jgi:hypothetical protein